MITPSEVLQRKIVFISNLSSLRERGHHEYPPCTLLGVSMRVDGGMCGGCAETKHAPAALAVASCLC